MRRFGATWMHAVSAVMVAGTVTCAQAATDACKATTNDALASCQAGARSDKSLALGKCNNVPDAAARKTCHQQALADLQDALATCSDERDVREAACLRFGPAPYHPTIDPTKFTTNITNRYFPLKPGTTFIYESHNLPDVNHTEFAVTHNTKTILGVTCVEVHDTVRTNGELTEDTLDWFAQDMDGNVWYFGEDTMELSGGRPTTLEGTFVAGINGAEPGIIMEAHPALGDFYRQEFDLRNAEDEAEVVGLDESVMAGGQTYPHTLKTTETTPLEPDLVEHKFYALDVGNVLTVDESTGERVELIGITTEP